MLDDAYTIDDELRLSITKHLCELLKVEGVNRINHTWRLEHGNVAIWIVALPFANYGFNVKELCLEYLKELVAQHPGPT
jgi:hypothetical protein